MAKSSYIGANVEIQTDTFASFINKVNAVFDDMGKYVVTAGPVTDANTTNGALTVGNAAIQGVFSANVGAFGELRGGTIANPSPVTISSNVAIKANTVVNFGTNTNRIENVFAKSITANTFTVQTANVEILTSNSATINVASINTAIVNTANVNSLSANTAEIANNITINGNLTVFGVTSLASNNALSVNTAINEILTVNKLAMVNGNTVIGNSASTTLTINSKVNSNIVPNANNFSIGQTDGRFANAWISSLEGNVNFNGIVSVASGRVLGKDGSNTFVISTQQAAGAGSVVIRPNGSTSNTGQLSVTSTDITYNDGKVWHAGNQGDTSGLDADLLDGQHGSFYLNPANFTSNVPVSRGGTGANTASSARANLGLGNLAVANTITTSLITDFQTVLATKQDTIVGAASTVANTNLAVSRAVVSDANGKIAVSSVTSTELSYLAGVSSAIQTQLNSANAAIATKQDTIVGAASTVTSSNLTVSRAVVSDANGKISTVEVSTTEIGYLAGVSSAIQTQLNNRLPLTGGNLSGNLEISKTDPSVFFQYPSVKRARFFMDGSGNLIYQDQGGQNHFYITGSGNLWSQAYGWLHEYYATKSNPTISGNMVVTGTQIKVNNRWINSDGSNLGFLNTGGGWAAYSQNDGTFVAVGNLAAYSDPELKENKVKISEALQIVKNLNGYYFDWKSDKKIPMAGKHDVGVMADEIESVLPELVSLSAKDEETGEQWKTVSYEKLVPVLIEAIKELQIQIEELRGN